MIKRYRKRPVEIEALEHTGNDDVLRWVCGDGGYAYGLNPLYIETLEGDMLVSKGDFVIKGVAGEFYPCKPDIFAQSYEAIP